MSERAYVELTLPEPRARASLASVLRWAGALTVLVSAAVYMLEGVQDIHGDTRNWIQLGLIVLLGGAGAVAQRTMTDPKAARLLLGLAAVLLPVQLSQVGGLVHELYAPATDGGDPTLGVIAPLVALTALAFVPVGYAVFSILARPYAWKLTLAYLALGAPILLPFRDSPAGVVVIGGLLLAVLVAEKTLFVRSAHFRTWEGRAVRAMFLLPLLIVAIRALFHVDSVEAYCALGALVGLLGLALPPAWTDDRRVVIPLQAVGVIIAGASWWISALYTLAVSDSGYAICVRILPLAALAFVAAEASPSSGRLLRAFATVAAVVAAGVPLASELGYPSALLALATGVVGLGLGIRHRERIPACGGGLAVLAGALALAGLLTVELFGGGWLTAALAGAAIILLSSVVERHGAALGKRLSEARASLAGWD